MKYDESFDLYLAKINSVIMRLKQMKSEVNAEEQLYVLLNGLPDSYDSLRQSLEVNDKSFDECCQKIRDYEEVANARRVSRNDGNDNTDVVNYAGNNRRDIECYTCRKKGHISVYCPNNKDVKKCMKCLKLGHTDEECTRNTMSQMWRNAEQRAADQRAEQNNMAIDQDSWF